MYKVTGTKTFWIKPLMKLLRKLKMSTNGKPIRIRRLEIMDHKIYAVYYVNSKDSITYDFPENLDEFKIEEVHTKKGEQNESS